MWYAITICLFCSLICTSNAVTGRPIYAFLLIFLAGYFSLLQQATSFITCPKYLVCCLKLYWPVIQSIYDTSLSNCLNMFRPMTFLLLCVSCSASLHARQYMLSSFCPYRMLRSVRLSYIFSCTHGMRRKSTENLIKHFHHPTAPLL